MIKRTPQEIADFYGCYVAQDRWDEAWCFYGDRPIRGQQGWHALGYLGKIPREFIDVPADHDWTKFYEPQGKEWKTEDDFPCSAETADSDNKQEAYSGKPADSDNKEAPHQSQVHVHSEYDVVYGGYPAQLSIKVTQLMHEGWRPLGGVAVEDLEEKLDDHRCIFYQAMVRGLK